MSHKLLTFAPKSSGQHEINIPTPFNYQPGQSYARICFEDSESVPIGFCPSTVFIVLEGSSEDGMLHALNTPNGAVIARLAFHPNGRVQVESRHMEYPSHVCAREELDIMGAVVELYLSGLKGRRYVLEPTRTEESVLGRPLLSASATL